MVCGELAANCGCGGNRVDIPCVGFGSVRWRYGYENILFHDGCGGQEWKCEVLRWVTCGMFARK